MKEYVLNYIVEGRYRDQIKFYPCEKGVWIQYMSCGVFIVQTSDARKRWANLIAKGYTQAN